MLRRALIAPTVSATALLAAACASTPELATAPDAAEAPTTYLALAGEGARPAAGDWIAAFGDPRLERLVAEALAANPDVAAAAASLEAARANARLAGAARLPSLDGGLDASYRDSDLQGSTESWSLGLSARWEADVWGRLTDSARAGALGAEAAEADLEGARLSIAGAAARSWFQLVEARLQTGLAERDVDTRQRQLDIVERRFASGVARSSEVRTARSALASARAALASRRQAEAASARGLEALLGRYPGATLQAVDGLPALSSLPGAGAPAELLKRRPDVVAAEARLASAGFSASAAQKALYPRLNLNGSIDTVANDPGDLFDADALVEQVAGSIVAPIFRGGALRAERDRAEAQARQAAAQYVSTVLTAWREAENAIDGDARLAERVAALSEALEEAAAAQALVERQYASGVATIFELLDAQSRVITAEQQLLAAQRERATNRVDFHLAVAGGFSAGGGYRVADTDGAAID